MIRHALTVSELRMFEADEPGPMDKYDASCMLMWESATVVWIRMLKGELSRKMLRELVQWFMDNGVESVRSHRAQGHVLPRSHVQADGSFVSVVSEIAKRSGTQSSRSLVEVCIQTVDESQAAPSLEDATPA